MKKLINKPEDVSGRALGYRTGSPDIVRCTTIQTTSYAPMPP